MKNTKYRVTSHTFQGRSASGSYEYLITFNKSLEHTGKFKGIEDGLNAYDKKDNSFWTKLKNVFNGIHQL